MGVHTNPDTFGLLTTDGTTYQVQDGVSSIHSGIIKALWAACKGNYVIDGCDITQTDGGSWSNYAVAAGQYFLNGELKAFSGANVNLGTIAHSTANYDRYEILVITGTSAVALRNSVGGSALTGATTPQVAELQDDDVPVALVEILGGTAADLATRKVQFLTFDQEAQSLSLGYSNSGYTEMSKITAASGGTTVEVATAGGHFTIDNTDADKNIIMQLGSDNADTAFQVKDNTGNVKFGVTGAGVFTGAGAVTALNSATANELVTVGATTTELDAEANLTFSGSQLDVGGNAVITQGSSGGQIAFKIDNDDTDKVAMNIDAANIDADVLDIGADAVTTANVIDITADALTTGSILNIVSASSSTGTRNLAYIHNNHASAVNTTALKVESISTDGSTDTSTAPTLHVKTASAGPAVTIESTVASADEAPEITLLSSAGSGGSGVGAASDDIGYIQFLGPDAGSATASQQYVELRADIKTATAGAEKGRFLIRTYLGGTGYINNIQCQPSGTIINDASSDIDFRVESNDETHMVFVDGGNNRVSIGDSVDAPAATLEVTNHADAGAYNVPLLQLNSNDTNQIGLDINAANIDANIIDISSDDALTTGKVLHIDVNNGATTAITPTYLHFDFDKDGVVADGVTSTFTALDIDMNDAATNHANATVTMTGIDMDMVSANAQGTLVNIGADINISGADNNYAIKTTGGSLQIGEISDAPADVAAYGQLWVHDTTPNELMFTTDAGTDIQLTIGATGPMLTGKHTIWVPASAMYPTTTSGSSALTQVELSNGPELKCLDFDDGSDEYAQFTVAFPKSWNGGTVTYKAYWCSSATDTDGVSWALQGCGMNDNETTNLTFGTAIVVDDANQGAANELLVTAESGAITIAGTPADDDLTFFQIFRDVSDGNDTAAEDARLLGIKLYYTLDAGNDA